MSAYTSQKSEHDEVREQFITHRARLLVPDGAKLPSPDVPPQLVQNFESSERLLPYQMTEEVSD